MNRQKGGGKPPVPQAKSVPFNREYDVKIDRYCSECGEIIYNQCRQKLGHCPKSACKTEMRFRGACTTVATSNMLRCSSCDAYLHDDDSFCMICKWANTKAISRKKRLAVASNSQEGFQKNAKIRKLEEDLAAERKKNAELVKDLSAKEKQLIASQEMEGVVLEDEDDLLNSPVADFDEKKENEDANKS